MAIAPSAALAITTWLGSRSASARDRVLSMPQTRSAALRAAPPIERLATALIEHEHHAAREQQHCRQPLRRSTAAPRSLRIAASAGCCAASVEQPCESGRQLETSVRTLKNAVDPERYPLHQEGDGIPAGPMLSAVERHRWSTGAPMAVCS
jgi:hypothetical protein